MPDKEDDFIIKNEPRKSFRGRSIGENRGYTDRNTSMSTSRKRKHNYKKYNHTKTFSRCYIATLGLFNIQMRAKRFKPQ